LLRQAQEQQRLAAARLADTLHLDATVELVAQDAELVPVTLTSADTPLDKLVQQALAGRPELKQSTALIAAAREAKNGASIGPLIPSLGVQGFVGGFGGGHDNQPDHFGNAEDVLATLSWRIGPGGLFDDARERGATARLNSTQLVREKLADEIRRQAVESATRVRSQADQIATAKQTLATAEETLRLTAQRKEFGVGIVLEYLQAEQDLTRSRADYLTAVAEFDKAQYALRRALGERAP
jgi:outer membrane protein TolC